MQFLSELNFNSTKAIEIRGKNKRFRKMQNAVLNC